MLHSPPPLLIALRVLTPLSALVTCYCPPIPHPNLILTISTILAAAYKCSARVCVCVCVCVRVCVSESVF